MATNMSVPPSSFFYVACLNFPGIRKNLLGTISRKYSLSCFLLFLFFSAMPATESITLLILLFRPSSSSSFFSKVMKTHTHMHIFRRYTQINRPWQGCVSRWQRWRGHGHRAVWGVALREVNHPDTWRRTRTVQVPPWWCALLTTGQKMGKLNDLTGLNGHAKTFFCKLHCSP